MLRLVETRLAEMKRKAFEELSHFPAYQAEKVKQNGKTFIVSVWADSVGQAEVRIVVQAYRHLFFGIGRMAADGFRIDQCGTIRKLSRQELYEFI